MCYVAEREALLIPCQAVCLCCLAGVTYCSANRREERLQVADVSESVAAQIPETKDEKDLGGRVVSLPSPGQSLCSKSCFSADGLGIFLQSWWKRVVLLRSIMQVGEIQVF